MKLRFLLLLAFCLTSLLSVTADACEMCVPDYPSGMATCVEAASGGRRCAASGVNCMVFDPCGGGGCFVAGAAVDTPNGPIPIEVLDVGDLVMSFDADSGLIVESAISHVYRSVEVGYIVINGATSVTTTHPFLVGAEWVVAEHLRVGYELRGSDGRPIVVQTLDRVDRGVRVYNISVENTRTFFVDGVLVHNKEGDPQG